MEEGAHSHDHDTCVSPATCSSSPSSSTTCYSFRRTSAVFAQCPTPTTSLMDSRPHYPSKYHHHYPFSPDAASGSGLGNGQGQPRDPAAGEPADAILILAVPAGWLIRLAAFLGEQIASAILSLVFPIAVLIGDLRAVPAAVYSLVRRAAFGTLAAACTFAALVAAFVLSVLLGSVLVRHWVEEPVTVHQPLYFDYTEAQPSAAVALGGARGTALPAGHSVRVSMALLLPDSYHNRQVGVFQIKAEAISPSGNTIASTTQPYMLRYKSSPVRLAQTALMCVPLTMGIRSESQAAKLKLLHYREGHGRHKKTGLLRVLLQPRALAVDLPQVYKAEIVVQTSLPWAKELARSLKWTMCVWVSFSVYVFLLVLAVCWVCPVALPAWDRRSSDHQANGKTIFDLCRRDTGESSNKELPGGAVVKWRERRSKRKAQLGILHGGRVELMFAEDSASSVAVESGVGSH